ncbi:MAG: SurA N-terminal domain-containing protein [Treponema sp.]|nr:SurA N-terminal domain-containing protein [Treponema sp.]
MAFKDKKAPVKEKQTSSSEIARRFKENPGVFIGTIVVLVLVTVSFVIVPAIVPEYSRGRGGDLTFGYYDKVPISYVPGNYFAQYLERYMSYYQSMVNEENYQSISFEAWRGAFEATAVHTAILQEVKKSGYTVPSKVVDREVAQLPMFHENGRFSTALYQRMSSSDRLTLWRQIQDDIAKQIFFSDMNSLLKSTEEGKFIGNMGSRMRSFDMAAFSVDDFPDSECLAYTQEYPQLFREINLSRISVSSGEREAQQILASIKDGSLTFEDAARAYSQDSYADRGGDMGVRISNELQYEITNPADLEKVMSLERGELSDIIHIEPWWTFFRVEETARPVDFNDVMAADKVRNYIRNFARGRMEDWAIKQASDFIAEANTLNFDAALSRLSKEKQSFGPIPLNYGNVDLFTSLNDNMVPELSNSAFDDYFWRTIFSTPVNTLSQALVQGSSVLVFLPTEEIEAEESSTEGIASTYSSYWLNYRTEESIYNYFLKSDKMDSRFSETYFNNFFAPGG